MASAMNLWSNKRKTGRLLAIARPASKKTCLYYERTSQKLMPQKSSAFRQFPLPSAVFDPILWHVLARSVVWPQRPALLWTCDWRSLKMYFSGPVSADAILSLCVCFTKMWWDSTTPNCYDLGFCDFLVFLCCFGSFAFHVFSAVHLGWVCGVLG